MGITLIRSSKCKVFPPFPFYSLLHNQLGVIFFPCLHLFLSARLLFKSNFLVVFFFLLSFLRFLQEIVPGGVEEVRVAGWLWGRSMICACVFVLCVCVCVPRLLCCTFKFPVVWVRATWVGRRVAHSTKNISAASNWCTISPCRSRQPAAEWTENSLWWFPLLHWHSFTHWLLLPMYHSALISQTLGTVLNNKVLVTYSQMCFWQMYNASCLLFSLCLSFMFNPRGGCSDTKGRRCLQSVWQKPFHAFAFTPDWCVKFRSRVIIS